MKPQRARRSHLGLLITTLLLILSAAWLVFNRQYVVDQVTVWQYRPSQAVAALAERSSMNDGGRFLFYAAKPQIESTSRFNEICSKSEQGVNILGCYSGGLIYVYGVTDPKLDGVKEVTAAHEMLHVAYERLDGAERQRVDGLIEAEFSKLQMTKALQDRLAYYASSEPGQRDNELHSIIGTEVATVSPELEAYYKRYFTDRSAVTALHARYNGVFTALQAQADTLVQQLEALRSTISTKTDTYNAGSQQLNEAITQFNERAAAGEFTSQSAFASERAALEERVRQQADKRTEIDRDIEAYNKLKEQLTVVAGQSNALTKSLDSSLAPPPQL